MHIHLIVVVVVFDILCGQTNNNNFLRPTISSHHSQIAHRLIYVLVLNTYSLNANTFCDKRAQQLLPPQTCEFLCIVVSSICLCITNVQHGVHNQYYYYYNIYFITIVISIIIMEEYLYVRPSIHQMGENGVAIVEIFIHMSNALYEYGK